MYTTRRGGFDREDARLHYAQLQKRKTVPRVGDKVVLSDHPTAQVYTVTEVASVVGGTRLVAQLMYISEYGMHCNAGGVDVSSLMTPTEQQLTVM
jgi:hypothetical protein